ncbi:nodulation protein NopC [Mesorhizobium waimense]|uniref:Nodulation protein NopC n=1 Tax=Mesorhizobium waimense TaxID=1300307 RepID=A0A3A5K5G6_9HYPH|nr:nodulation protein NopC [Mesorhizobium waimense]
MIAAIGDRLGSLARTGHGHSNGQSRHASSERSGHSNGPSGPTRPGGEIGRADSPTFSGDGSQAAGESEAFEAALRSVALTIVNDAMADADDALADTEEDA